MLGQDVSLEDVARAAGVSPATASRALNGRTGVREEVRTRVTLVADGLGYRPNLAAKNLAGGRTSIIALVLANGELLSDPYAAAVVQSVGMAAREADEGLMLILEGRQSNRTSHRLVDERLVEGVIVTSAASELSWVEDLMDKNLPMVLIGGHPRRVDIPTIDVESSVSSARIVGHMLDSGCRRVAMIMGRPQRVCSALRFEGFRAAHEQRGLEIDPELIFDGSYDYNSGRRSADRIIDLDADGVFAANDEMAVAVIHRAIERGIDIPCTLSVAGFDGFSASPTPGMILSTVEQPVDEIARLAVATLANKINGMAIPMEQRIEPRLILGSTTRQTPAPAD